MFGSALTQDRIIPTIAAASQQEKQVNPKGYLESMTDSAQSPTPPGEHRSDRVRSWRRRVLLRRGALMHVALGADAKNCSLAMLDEEGVVVSWYAPADGVDRRDEQVVGRHVSQFYVPEDVAYKQPLRDLRAAAIKRSNIRQGWRRRPDGTAFWGTTVIEAILLRDGRLQGFSYVTRASAAQSASLPIAQAVVPACGVMS